MYTCKSCKHIFILNLVYLAHRIHGAGIYANMTGVY